ncbi:MAG: hypothetical protein HGB15_07655 [Chlorobaculum sp.]|nr:hypothetical protein [Chlorobaculum sp.]
MDKQKHLDIIQGVINRMANCSFLIKGWTITITAAIFGLAAKDADIRYVIIAYMVIPFFWLLDAFYLSKERQYRALYDEVRIKDENDIDFLMDTSNYDIGRCTWWNSFFSKTLNIFYIPLFGVVLIIMFVFKTI